jgi:hypothetical protein
VSHARPTYARRNTETVFPCISKVSANGIETELKTNPLHKPLSHFEFLNKKHSVAYICHVTALEITHYALLNKE